MKSSTPKKTNLGNAAFFAIKGLKKEIEDIKQILNSMEQRLDLLEK